MRTQISITKRNIFTLILFLLGLYCLYRGIYSDYKYKHAIPLETLQEQSCKEGAYVVGYIDSYLGMKIYGSNRFSGVSQTFLSLAESWDFYTIPVSENTYIEVMLSDKATKNALDDFTEGKGEGVYFEGEIIKPVTGANLNWYASLEDFDMDTLIQSFVIREATLEKKKDIAYLGIILLMVSLLLFIAAGGINSILIKEPIEDIPDRTAYEFAKSYNKQNELIVEINRLETLENRLASFRKSCLFGFPILGLGVYILNQAYLLEAKFIGLLLILSAVRNIWRYFINSTNALSVFLAEKCNLNTLALQMRQCEKNIDLLKELLSNERDE